MSGWLKLLLLLMLLKTESNPSTEGQHTHGRQKLKESLWIFDIWWMHLAKSNSISWGVSQSPICLEVTMIFDWMSSTFWHHQSDIGVPPEATYISFHNREGESRRRCVSSSACNTNPTIWAGKEKMVEKTDVKEQPGLHLTSVDDALKTKRGGERESFD